MRDGYMRDGRINKNELKYKSRRALDIILNLIYPPVCGFCGERLNPDTVNKVCDKCANTLPYCLQYQRCNKCGKPLQEGKACNDCKDKRIYFTRITSAFLYTGDVKDAIVAMKKEDGANRADMFSVYVSQMVKNDFGGVSFDCVVSVPPRKKPIYDEHFDQAGYLARKTAGILGLPYFKKVLYQKGKVTKQSTLKRSERAKNVKDAFEIYKGDRIKDKTILIIDDVCTTGATLNECAKVLKESGAYRVYAATAATVLTS